MTVYMTLWTFLKIMYITRLAVYPYVLNKEVKEQDRFRNSAEIPSSCLNDLKASIVPCRRSFNIVEVILTLWKKMIYWWNSLFRKKVRNLQRASMAWQITWRSNFTLSLLCHLILGHMNQSILLYLKSTCLDFCIFQPKVSKLTLTLQCLLKSKTEHRPQVFVKVNLWGTQQREKNWPFPKFPADLACKKRSLG